MSDEVHQLALFGDAAPMRIVISTFPDETTAKRIALALVDEQLVACVNVLPGVTSIYRWEGKQVMDTEIMGVFKTAANPARVMERLKAMHPYEVPEMIVLSVSDVHPAYLKWIRDSSK
jgi:periplasmic divalent cation tolerance protein